MYNKNRVLSENVLELSENRPETHCAQDHPPETAAGTENAELKKQKKVEQ